MATPTVYATPVDSPINQTMRLQIPNGLYAGDTFAVTPDNGRVFTVIVPENALPGSYIEVVVPTEGQWTSPVDANGRKTVNPSMNKATAGAALVGGVVGTLLLGPVVGILLAGGAAFAT
jgi:hypothetical protein